MLGGPSYSVSCGAIPMSAYQSLNYRRFSTTRVAGLKLEA